MTHSFPQDVPLPKVAQSRRQFLAAAQAEDRPLLPNWVPKSARSYLDHTLHGRSMRALARAEGGHASTILRRVRKLETRRDDPLVDEVLTHLGQDYPDLLSADLKGPQIMMHSSKLSRLAKDQEVNKEARRILRRLCETTAFLVVAPNLDMAAVMRESQAGNPVRIAVLDRKIAQVFALKDWIECFHRGQVNSYRITTAGRAALKRLLAEDDGSPDKVQPVPSPFQEQHKDWQQCEIADDKGRRKRLRFNLAESPLTALGRRKGSDGKAFLAPELVQAGERLREDFEMAQMGPRVTQNWDRFLTTGRSGGPGRDSGIAEGPMAARERVSGALRDLGPGLGDIALRCCCYLEGMETAEKRMGWSARSGKIVLRIALQRLKLHYEAVHGMLSPKIG